MSPPSLRKRELRKAGTAARMAVSATEGASLGGGREQKLAKDIEQLVGDKGKLEAEIRNLQSRVSASDEELRLANQHANHTNDLYAEELAVAQAEKLSAEEARLHASRVYGVQLESAVGQTAVYAGMGAMLTTAHAERTLVTFQLRFCLRCSTKSLASVHLAHPSCMRIAIRRYLMRTRTLPGCGSELQICMDRGSWTLNSMASWCILMPCTKSR